MLKIPKQIYFDQETLELYSRYAQSEKKSFAAVVREVLEKEAPRVKEKVAVLSKTKSLLDLYGAGKSPYKKRFSAKEERTAFYKAIAKNAAQEGL